jgi:hypothetical protein
MALLRGVKHKNLVHVDDVFVIRGAKEGAGVIVRELVGETMGSLTELEAAARDLDALVERAEERVDDLMAAEVDENELESYQALSETMDWLYDEIGDAAEDNEAGSGDRKALLGVKAAIRKLKSLGIYGIDFPSRNIAMDDLGNAVVFDVGAVDFFGKLWDIKNIDCRA